MQKNHRKYPMVFLFVLVLGLVGFKDVGIFVNGYSTTSNGVELNYLSNDRVTVIGEDEVSYDVVDNNNYFNVPKSDLLRVHNGVRGYIVTQNTPIYDQQSNSVLRLLFIDEYLEIKEDRGNQVLVTTTKDNITGLVDKTNLEKDRIRNIVEGYMVDDYTATNDSGQTYNLSRGDKVDVAWFESNYFIVFDQNKNKFNINADLIDLNPTAEESLDNSEENHIPLKDGNTADQLISRSKNHLGRPYVWGDTGKEGFDCSGLVYSLYQEIAGITLPRSSAQMASAGVNVPVDQIDKGDLLFFNSGGDSGISHVAMYIGDGEMIHASNMQNSIVIDPISGNYFQNNFVNAQRILD